MAAFSRNCGITIAFSVSESYRGLGVDPGCTSKETLGYRSGHALPSADEGED